MTKKQEKHLADIKYNFAKLVDAKYRKGQKEHGGTMTELSIEYLIDCAVDEAIDQVVYLLTLRDKLTSVSLGTLSKNWRNT